MQVSFAIKNTIASLLVEVVAAVSGIILPRYFISVYGSSINGLASSIGQFITYMSLVEAGLGTAATVELYKPLSVHDHSKINEIVSAAKGFYYRSGLLFIVLDVALVLGYPYIVRTEITDSSFVRMMIIVLSGSGFIDYFLLGKYRVLLVADQKTYIIAIAQSLGTIVTLFVSIILIRYNCSPIIVKSVVPIVYLLRTFYIIAYVKNNYPFIDVNTKYSKDVFPQRHSALFHQIIGMICNNTDIVLLTVMLNHNALIEVSVYAAYNMVAANITLLFNSISKGIGASFGNIIAKGDNDSLNSSFCYFELLFFVLLFIIYTCMAILLYPFISLYTSTFLDADVYLRWSLVILFTSCGIVQNIRIPGMTVQTSAGHYKQTQGAALLEAIINLGISVALVRTIGINGVLLGTLAAYLYRTSYVIFYNARHFLQGTLVRTFLRLIRNIVLFAFLVLFGIKFLVPNIHSWFSWIVYACLLSTGSSLAFITLNMIFEPSVLKKCFNFIIDTIRKSSYFK